MSRVALCVMSSGLVLALGCGGSEDRPSGPAGRLAIEVAPLTLDGVIDAEYTVTVRNGPGGSGEVVWERRVTSAQFGDGAGSLSYVGPCDAATGVNTVTLQLHDLWDAGGEIDPGTYQNPTPLEREAVCVANADVTVTFDMTIVRESNQGFFDVAVDFEDVFCSAKLDCEDDQGGDLDLLHRPGGGPRDMTAVFAFACTGTLAAGETVMYMDDLRIACSGLARDVLIDPTGLGNIDTNASPSENADGYLFGAAVYRGAEALAGKAYWNVNLGLDAEAFTRAGDCTLRARATASSELWLPEHDGFPLPPASVYPVIHWDVPLSSSIARVCGQHAVNAGDGAVSTVYEGYLPVDVNAFTWAAETVYLRNRYRPSTGEAIRAGGDLCNPPCVSGRCVGVDQCDCDTGWQGGVCDEPVCTDDCNAGTCTAPGICDCAATGYAGERCETNIDECASGGHDCHADATCTDTPGSWDCVCNSGYSGDGVTCADVDECLTDNGGCDANATCTNTAGSRTCACNSGYSGDGVTCTDVDECLTDNGGCDANATCTNTAGSRTCACNAGYSGDGVTCADVDECLTDNGGCDADATCTNTAGSRTCACNSGYSGDGVNCADVNECLTDNGGCDANATCTNTAGSRTCACNSGYSGDGVNCADVNECLTNNGGCDANATCTNTAGSRTCACNSGYSGDGVSCADVNECLTNNGGCDANATCTNTVGSRTCACNSGYSGDGVTCADVNECLTNNGGCDTNATCTNTAGSRTCACNSGYSGDGVTCADVNECVTNNGGCDTNATCTNTAGSRTCACNSGYSGDGVSCADVNECLTNNGGCDANATCTNTVGSRTCACNSGYSGDGVSCADVNECLTNNGGCDANATCTNTVGSRTCACNSGYSGDGVSCADVNECLTNNGGCAHSCHNTSGGYSCSCNSGYVLAGDGHACNDIDECLTGNGGCDANALCTNTPGSRTCACNAGFVGDGSTCVACQPAHPLASTRAWLPEAIETIASYPTRTFGEVSLGVGVRGQGLVFDGADDYIEVIDSDPLYPTGALSIEAWVKTSAAGVEQVVASKYECGDDCVGSVSNSRFMLRVDPTGKVTFNVRDSLGVEDLVTGATTVTDGVFHHVVGVRDVTGSTLRVYVDGVLDGSAGINGTAGLADDDGGVDNLIVGAISDHADGRVSFFHGTIDELALHHEALTPTQVATRYASAVPSCACPVGYEPDGAGGCADIDECSVGAAGCSPHGACTNTTGSYTCECPVSSGYFGDGFFCGPPYTSCLDALEAGETTDGLQWFDEGPGMLVWCDQTTDGGGWMLMAKFSQHISIDNLDQATYDAYFGSSHVNGYKTWIQGEAQGTPLSPDPRYDGFVVESHDWSNFPGISVGNQGIVELRQQFFKRSREQEFDVTFESKGGTVDHAALPQNDIVNKWFRAWWLGGRRVLKDDTGITWDTANDWFRFWLPIDGSGDSWASDNFITGCAGFSLDPFACGIVTPANRRYGNAGIIGSYADYQDPAAAWAPHLNAAATSDIVYVHQAHTQYGESGDPMTLLYWLREKRCATHSDCAGGGCMNGYCQGYERSCKRILQFFNPSAPDGIYTIDISEQALGHPLKPPMEVYCDMTNGGWTRLYRDDFETGVPTGWLENRTTECGGDTILGGYFNESSATTVNAKAYPSLSFPAEQIKLNMDFVKLDSWDGETVDIKLAYQSGYSESFCHCHQGCGGVCGGAALCGAGSAEDQRISVQGIPQFFGSNGNADYDVRVETTLDQENSDESFGVDNVEIWAID